MKDLIFIVTCVAILGSVKQQTNAESKTNEMQARGPQMDQKSKDQNNVDLMEIMNECNNTFRTDIAFIQALNDSGSFPDESDRTPKCFVRCVMENTRIASQDGVYDPEQAAMVFGGERGGKVMTDLEDIARSCAMRDEKCKCERAYQFMKCLMEKEIEEYEKSQ